VETIRTLTILKTDIRRFTDRVESLRTTELDSFLREHRDLVSGVLRAWGGTLVKEIGDSFLVTFESSTRALQCAVALQREVAATNLGAAVRNPLEIRIAVNSGDVLLQDGDIFGTPVNVVARLEASTPPGEIYLTEAVFQNQNEISVEPVGLQTLKGIAEPVQVHRVAFRHQLQLVKGGTVMFTDLIGFSRFTAKASPEVVESLLTRWELAHRDATGAVDGTLRMAIADAYFLTFDSPAAGIRAWLSLATQMAPVLKALDGPEGFSAGLSVGDIMVFRSSIFGNAANQASRLTMRARDVPGTALALPAQLLPDDPALAEQVEITRRGIVLPDSLDGSVSLDVAVLSPKTRGG